MKDPIKVKQGKQSRAQGAAFERRVREDLEANGWICAKWSNNVEFEKFDLIGDSKITTKEVARQQAKIRMDIIDGRIPCGKLIPAKAKWAGPGRPMMLGAGFPDFIAYTLIKGTDFIPEVIGVESKMDGKLDKAEKEKTVWLLKNNIFSKIFIASKVKENNRIKVKYEDFQEKYGNKSS